MERRKFVIGMGSLAAGSAAAVGSGAFSSVEAERDITVETGGDNEAYLGLEAGRNDIISEDGGDGQLSLDLGSQTTEKGGEGFNDEAVTVIEDVFIISNQGTEEVEMGFKEGDPVWGDNVTNEIEPIDGVTLSVGDEVPWLDAGESTAVDVTVDTLSYDPEEEEDGTVTIGASVEEF